MWRRIPNETEEGVGGWLVTRGLRAATLLFLLSPPIFVPMLILMPGDDLSGEDHEEQPHLTS